MNDDTVTLQGEQRSWIIMNKVIVKKTDDDYVLLCLMDKKNLDSAGTLLLLLQIVKK